MKTIMNITLDLPAELSIDEVKEKVQKVIEVNGWEKEVITSLQLPTSKDDTIETKIGIGAAIFQENSNQKKRYFFSRVWNDELPVFVAFLMNPSTADEIVSDPASAFLSEYARKNGYGALYIVNTSPNIKPSGVNKSDFPLDNSNMDYIEFAMNKANTILLGWGEKGQKFGVRHLLGNHSFLSLIEANKEKLRAFGFGSNNNVPFYPKYPTPPGKSHESLLERDLLPVSEEDRQKLFHTQS